VRVVFGRAARPRWPRRGGGTNVAAVGGPVSCGKRQEADDVANGFSAGPVKSARPWQ
jgi:hypothetical protein